MRGVLRIGVAAALGLALLWGAERVLRPARHDPSDLTEVSARRLEILEHLREGRFEELERFITAYQAAYERGEVDERVAAVAFAPFYTSHPWAGAQLDAWVEAMPDSWAARAGRGTYHWRMGLLHRGTLPVHHTMPERMDGMRRAFELARADFEAALEARPRLMWCYGNLIWMAVYTGSREHMQELLARAEALDPDTHAAPVAYLSGLEVHWGGKPGEWLPYLEELAGRAERNPLFLAQAEALLSQRAQALAREGEHEAAIRLYREAVSRHETVEFVTGLGHAYRWAGRYDGAASAYTRRLEILPGGYLGYEYRGNAHRSARRLLQAVQDYRAGLEHDPLSPSLRMNLGFALELGGNHEEAIEEYAKSVEWNHDLWTLRRLAELLLTHGDDAETAAALLVRAIQIDPGHKDSWYWLGRGLERLEHEDARLAYGRYLELADPDVPQDRLRIAEVESLLDPEVAAAQAEPTPDAPPGVPANRLPGLHMLGLAAR